MAQASQNVSASQSGSAYASDVNDALLAIQTNHSGGTAPSYIQALQWWADTSANFLKLRDAGNTTFYSQIPLDKSMATYVGELIGVYGLGTTAPLKSGDNLNSVDPTGVYRITTSTSNNTYGNGSVLVANRGGGVVDQLIISVTDSKVYFRNTQNNGSLWTKLGAFTDLTDEVNTNTSKVATLETIHVPVGYISTPVPTYATARTITINGTASAKSGDGVHNIRITGNHTVSLDVTGIDGLASGSVASNTWYYLYAVSLADGTGGGYLFDTTQGLSSHSLGATNRILRSEELDNASWIKGGSPVATVTANQYLAPNGTLTADKITDSTDTAGSQISQAPTPTTNQSTLSFYCKRVDTDWLRVTYAQSTNQVRQWINLSTGVLGSTTTSGTAPTGISSTITNVGSGWYGVTLTATFASTTSMNVVFATASADANTTRVSGASYSVWGVQVNNGGTADGYVKTEGSIVTGTTTFRSRQLPLAVRTNGSSNIFPFRLLNWNGRTSSLRYITDMFISEFGLGATTTEIGAVSSGTYSAFSLASFVPPPSRIATLFAYSQGTGILYIRETGETLETRFYSGGTALVFNPTVPVSSAQSVDMRVGSSTFDVAVEGYTINL
jgi:hypothetical protein